MKKILSQLVPESVRSARRVQQEPKALRKVPAVLCDASALLPYEDVDIKQLFDTDAFASDWAEDERKIREQGFSGGVGGVNEGDRRAIYYLTRYFKPQRVLEVGTHVGASTVHIAAALQRNYTAQEQEKPLFITVDVADVNNQTAQPWLHYGAQQSPQSSVDKLHLSEYVHFITRSSLDYLADTSQRFDFIFLDGDHAASTVYQEVPLAVQALNNDGVVLLHDYYPDAQPLWSNKVIHPGPFMACERLREEGVALGALPLGQLPWPTKLGTNVTSLALLLRTHQQ